MPAKKPPADEPPPDEGSRRPAYVDRVRENCETTEGGEGICYDIMQEIVAGAENRMLSNYYDRTAIPYTVQCTCKELLDLMQFVFIARDPGDDAPGVRESWLPDEEPPPLPADTWARGVVPVRRPPPRTDAAAAPDARRGAARRAPKPTQPKPEAAASPSAASADPSGRAAAAPAAQRPEGGPRRRQSEQRAGTNAAAGTPDGGDSAGPRDRSEPKRRAEIREAAEKQHQALRDIARRDVIVDSINGRVIPVRPADPDRLPAKRLDMKVSVDTGRDAQIEKPPAEPAVSKAPRPAPGAGKKGKKKGGAASKWADFVQPEDTHGPLVDGCAPAGGVTLREGDRTTRQDLKVEKSKVSRSDFKKMLGAMGVHREAFDIAAAGADGSGAAAGARGADQQAPKSPADPPVGKKRPAAGGAAAAVQQQQQPRQPAARDAAAPGAKGDAGPPAELKPQSPAALPQFKPGLQELLGPRHHYPRDRHPQGSPRRVTDAADMDRPHPLPPPLYPASEGHGIVKGELAKQNPYAQGIHRPGSPDADSPRSARSSPRSSARSPQRIHVMPEAAGNEIAEDFFAGLAADDDYS